MFLTCPIPCTELQKLEFLLGEYTGSEVVYPPGRPPVLLQMRTNADWESSERYLRLELFSRASTGVYESMLVMFSYNVEAQEYHVWKFARTDPAPMFLRGTMDGNALVVTSDPSPMSCGTQRLRYELRPVGEEGYEVLGEYWTPDGWEKYNLARMMRTE